MRKDIQAVTPWAGPPSPHCHIYSKNPLNTIFYHCPEVFQFWREFGGWFNDVFSCYFKLGCLDILCGVMDQTNDDNNNNNNNLFY